MKRNPLAEIQSEMSKSSSCVNIIVNNHFNQAVPTSWDYGSFNPSSNYFSRTNLHNKENIMNYNNLRAPCNLPRSPDIKPRNNKEAKFTMAQNYVFQPESSRYKENLEDPIRISREGSYSASRVIDILKQVKSPEQIKLPKETEYLIDKVIRRKMYPVEAQSVGSKYTQSMTDNKLSRVPSSHSK